MNGSVSNKSLKFTRKSTKIMRKIQKKSLEIKIKSVQLKYSHIWNEQTCCHIFKYIIFFIFINFHLKIRVEKWTFDTAKCGEWEKRLTQKAWKTRSINFSTHTPTYTYCYRPILHFSTAFYIVGKHMPILKFSRNRGVK